MDTVQSRITIGFPKQKEDFAKSPAIFDDHTLKIAGHPVMEDWELGYMNTLAKIAAQNGGTVLELGFGLGLSAKAIQHTNITSHVVIECHPDVIAKCIQDFKEAISNNQLHVFSGFWQEVVPFIANESFDGILFDTYPLTEEEIHGNHFWFFEEAYRLLKPGGTLTYYSDEAIDFSQKHKDKLLTAGFKQENISFEVCHVTPPADCEYWQANTILAPIIKK